MIRPHASSDSDHYSRLFPPGEAFPEQVLIELGRSTAGNKTPIPPDRQTIPPPAGYTYFGQFIDHDLSFDKTRLADAGPDLSLTINHSGGRLDLNQLYGDGPESETHGHLYSDGISFCLGEARLPNGEPFDVPPTPPGKQPAHPLNLENIILRQLHAMFLKLHNIAVQDAPAHLHDGDLFEHARNTVRWQYQWLVRYDFLWRICDRQVYTAIAADPPVRAIDWRDGFSIPVEFAQAAFRFGHSMVREAYRLNRKRIDVPLEEIFSQAQAQAPLDPINHIDWRSFFRDKEETAKAIDTRIVLPLHKLPSEHAHHVVRKKAMEELPPELPVRTLLRGSRTRLPTGEQVERYFGRDLRCITSDTPGAAAAWRQLDQLGLHGKTPLWYYVLLEAETTARGRRLGPIGSWLVADVIEQALLAEATSFRRQHPSGWRPPEWPMGTTGKRMKIRRMEDVAIVTALV